MKMATTKKHQDATDSLFPVLSSGEPPPPKGQILFPVKSDSDCDGPPADNESGNFDWLENKSFLPTALLLAQDEVKSAVTSKSPSTNQTPVVRESSLSPTKHSPHTVTKSLKRSQSVSGSDEEGLPVKTSVHGHSHETAKVKKHKKKKKEHKSSKDAKRNSSFKDSRKSEADDHAEFWKTSTKKTFLEEMSGLEPEFAFRLDRKSEKSLWNYESLYKDHIARYFRMTRCCLGSMDICLHSKHDKHKVTVCRYYTKEKRKEIRAKGTFVKIDKSVQNETLAYISLKEKEAKSEHPSQFKGETHPPRVLDSATNVYSQGKGIEKKNETEKEPVLDETFERTAYYNKRLTEDPSNVKLWLEFVQFQDKIFQDVQFSANQMTSRRMQDYFQSPRACIEKKLAILDKALEANPSSLELKICKLETKQDVTDRNTLAEEWDKLLFVFSGDVLLWRHYLTFQQTRLTTFSVGHTIKLYHRCFKTLISILEGKVKVVKTTDSVEEEMIGIFEQYCSFLHQSGFTEKAVASYQALIEFNLFRPPTLNLVPTQDSVAVFESFWDSGVARFGEKGAKGWASWVENSTQSNQEFTHVSTEEEQEEILRQSLPVWQTWLRIERLRQGAHCLPWRPDHNKGETDEDCEDLDRLVLYDDVAPILFCLYKSSSCSQLVQQFVNLLGFQLQTQKDFATEFDQLELFALHQVSAASGLSVGVSVDFIWQPHNEVVQFLEEVLRQAATYFTGWHQTLFSCQLLQLQIEKQGCWDVSSMSTEASKEVRKFGKSLLKETQNRNDLLLWDVYIRNEWAFGKNKEAMSMLQTALAMFTSSISDDDHAGMAGLCSLYRTLAEISLGFTPTELVQLTGRKASPSGECKNKVISSFTCLVEKVKLSVTMDDAVPAAKILRARRKFQGMLPSVIDGIRDVPASCPARLYVVQLVHCFALFEWCAAGIIDSVQVFDSAFQLCAVASQKTNSSQTRKAFKELEKSLSLNLLCLLKNHMSVEAISLSQIRSRLHTGLSRFPNSPELLRQLVDLESKTFMTGKLRRYFESASQDPATVYPVLFEVLAEMGRHARLLGAITTQMHKQGAEVPEESMFDTGAIHRVRAACERGLQHKVTRHCPLLWRLYLHFEAEYGSAERARGIFYRALQTCPWSKVLYLDGAELFGTTQLQELVDLMTEKEVRVQIPLEEAELLMNSEPQAASEAAVDWHGAEHSVTDSS